MQIGATITAAGIASTGGIDWLGTLSVLGIPNSQYSSAGEKVAIPGISSGHDTIHHVNASPNGLNQVRGRPYAHQVSRLILWHQRRDLGNHLKHCFFWLAHRKTANGVALKPNLRETVQRCAAQVSKYATLDNPKQRIRRIKRLPRALCPAQTEFH